MEKITMLGTGNATVTHCFNTCFTIQTPHTTLLVDAGGGNTILSQLEKAHIALSDIHHMFVTHAHTDHILGTIWVIRMIASMKTYEGQLHIYANDKATLVMRTIVNLTFAKKHLQMVSQRIDFHCLTDGEELTAGDIRLKCFDIHSTKEKQYAFQATLPSSLVIACLGDEPYNELNHDLVVGADYLMSEAFCLYDDRERFKPYEKCHSTALDAGKLAQMLGAKNLILYHTEDKTLATRKVRYTEEAANAFNGRIFVPDDLEVIKLE